jgi:indolepyruvate ferredoxin oxidoreductase alpha subunit
MTFYWLKKADLSPDNPNIVFPGDIGCYSLGCQQGFLDTLVSMGASIGIGQSMPGTKVIILGDSTFYHAGIPALINAVQQKRDITVLILDNDSTAMTGHQPVPELDLKALCESCGTKVVEVDPFSMKTGAILKKAVNSKGVNVIIMKRSCPMLDKRKPIFVITDKCNDCGECDEINCPAIETVGNSHIINDLCWGCGFCAVICPEHAIKREKK